ncbi:MAG: DUF6986 family protein [Gemmatimonadaceae bacterium]
MTEASQALYVGADRFDAETPARAGAAALAQLAAHAPDDASFGAAMGIADAGLAAAVRGRVIAKLGRLPVEELRVDFEDGYGVHPDVEEDAVAARVGAQLVRLAGDPAAPSLGVRLKPLGPETRERSARTLDALLTAVAREAEASGTLPPALVVCVAKVSLPEQTAFAARRLDGLERGLGLPSGWARLEPMIEQPQAVLAPDGRVAVPEIVAAGAGRVHAVQFGVYDYTASCGIPASHQHLRHPVCDVARHLVQMALAGTGVRLVDGSTAQLPLAPEGADAGEARAAVHAGWRRHADDVRHSLAHGWYQGCDLHPTQLPSRYAALFAFYLDGLDASAARLARFLAKAEQATVVGAQFDDAATVQGLLAYFARAVHSGAVEAEAVRASAGLTDADLSDPVLARVLARRKGGTIADG